MIHNHGAGTPRFDPDAWSACLVKRLGIRLPDIIDANGRPIGHQISLDHNPTEIVIAADLRPSYGSQLGRFIAGTREPGVAPLLSQEARELCPPEIRAALVSFPKSYDESRRSKRKSATWPIPSSEGAKRKPGMKCRDMSLFSYEKGPRDGGPWGLNALGGKFG